MKLLIVDDHAPMRAMIREVIGPVARQVHECDSGDAAMRRCLHDLPDLITLDLHLGIVDGMAVLEFVRSVCPMVHVVVVTQADDQQLRTLVRRQGAAQFFAKSDLLGLRDYVEKWARKQGFSKTAVAAKS